MAAVVEKTIKENLNVRQLEHLIQQLNEKVSRETKRRKSKRSFLQERESLLRERFGTTVNIKKTKNKGKIEIEFFSQEDLERILELLDGKDLST